MTRAAAASSFSAGRRSFGVPKCRPRDSAAPANWRPLRAARLGPAAPTMAPPAKRPAPAADPADKRRRLDGGPTASTSATPVRLPRVPRGDTKQRHTPRDDARFFRDFVPRRRSPTSDLPSPAHPQTVAAIVRELRERAHDNGVHPTTVQSLAAPFADARFAETTENQLDEGLASTLRVLRQIAGPEVGSGARAQNRGDTQRVSNVLEGDPSRNGSSAPAPAPALGRALTAPPGVGVRPRGGVQQVGRGRRAVHEPRRGQKVRRARVRLGREEGGAVHLARGGRAVRRTELRQNGGGCEIVQVRVARRR